MEYTKGEWKAWRTEIKPDKWTICAGDAGEQGIARTVCDNSITPAEEQANAQLIASAPDLYEACRIALGWLKPEALTPKGGKVWRGDTLALKKLLEEALAKAEGK